MKEAHTRSSDETLIMAYILNQPFNPPVDVLCAIDRLNTGKADQLQDYSVPADED